jgi:hypothetical protein
MISFFTPSTPESSSNEAYFPAYARFQTSRYPVEAVSGRNTSKAGKFS